MIIFAHDNSFDGILTAVFDAYARKTFPDELQTVDMTPPLFCEETYEVITDPEKASRVWRALEKKLSKTALSSLTVSWLSELPEVGSLLFRYIRKAIDSPVSIEMNFGDPDVLALTKIWRKVGKESERVRQFIRFQKTSEGIYFGALEPIYNVFPLTIPFFKDRFADQQWIIYDIKRQYGYFYDLKTVEEIRFEAQEEHLISGILNDEMMAQDEKLFQQLWKQYFQSIAIRERINPKLHKQMLPVRFWKYLTEKQ